MAFILWRSAFSVENRLIDSQHQKLVDIINRLYDGISQRSTELKMQEIFNELISYTRYHFEAEESLMLKHGYAGMAQHKKAHTEFVNKVKELKLNTLLSDEKVKMEVFKFLKNWLTDHILNTDKNTFKTHGDVS
ncbi:MAG: hemerythrin family protein [Bacteroidales bacterium]|nr:hemerythrin family protein [Bacteroidales bacterium]